MLSVEVSQLDVEPRLLMIVGNAVPGEARRRVLCDGGAAARIAAAGDDWVSALDHDAELNRYAEALPLPPRRSRWDVDDDTLRPAPRHSAKAAAAPPSGEYVTEGLRIPLALRPGDQRSTNYVLTQCPGKLKPKDLKHAIDAQRSRRAEQRAPGASPPRECVSGPASARVPPLFAGAPSRRHCALSRAVTRAAR